MGSKIIFSFYRLELQQLNYRPIKTLSFLIKYAFTLIKLYTEKFSLQDGFGLLQIKSHINSDPHNPSNLHNTILYPIHTTVTVNAYRCK